MTIMSTHGSDAKALLIYHMPKVIHNYKVAIKIKKR